MSWSITIPDTPAALFEAAVDHAATHQLTTSLTAEERLQVIEAKETLKRLVQSGVVSTAGTLRAHLAGHANPGHALQGQSRGFEEFVLNLGAGR